jgi:phytol kinase
MSLFEGFRADLVPMLISALYVVIVIGGAEELRARGMNEAVTRKIVHLGIGMWIVPTYLLFDHWIWAALPAMGFVVLNGLAWHFGWFKSMEGEKRNIGVILFPLSTALALRFFWLPPWSVVGVAAILVLCWGDAAGALVGRRFGRTRYTVFDHQRSLEGSTAMFCASLLAIAAAFMVFGIPLTGGIMISAVIVAALATGVEAVCPWGLDNLLIPATVAIAMVLLRDGVWG